ncbi:MAG: SGNH/GDSL hydrolase family protein [Deltaproteobacteria bacterium]|nr:SGNH/GDSL hydrolase family protein [Deltaproteobacteria bacterium]
MLSSELRHFILAIPGKISGVLLFLACLLSGHCSLSTRSDSLPEFNDGYGGKGPALLIIGDSLSSGVMASFPIGKSLPRRRMARFSEFFFGSDHSLEASQRIFSEYASSSLMTEAPWGIRHKIAEKYQLSSADIPVIRGFKWGARLMNAISFVSDMEQHYPYPKKAEFIFIWIGGNDFCRDRSPEEFEREYRILLTKTLKIHPDATFFISLLPKFHTILEHSFIYSPALSCVKMRKAFCSPIFRPDARFIIQAYNQAIEKVITEAGEKQLKESGKHPGLYLISGMKELSLSQEDLCFDCFHPSIKGHQKFSEIFKQTIDDVIPLQPHR